MKDREKFSAQEKAIIQALQGDLPLRPRPFRVLGEQLGVEEVEILSKLQKWQKEGIIRRFGAVVKHRKLGFRANGMVVWVVPPERIQLVGNIMASFEEVSHCYQRSTFPGWPYTLFTMIHGRTKAEVEQVARRISQVTDVKNYCILYSSMEFKKTSMRYFLEEELGEFSKIRD